MSRATCSSRETKCAYCGELISKANYARHLHRKHSVKSTSRRKRSPNLLVDHATGIGGGKGHMVREIIKLIDSSIIDTPASIQISTIDAIIQHCLNLKSKQQSVYRAQRLSQRPMIGTYLKRLPTMYVYPNSDPTIGSPILPSETVIIDSQDPSPQSTSRTWAESRQRVAKRYQRPSRSQLDDPDDDGRGWEGVGFRPDEERRNARSEKNRRAMALANQLMTQDDNPQHARNGHGESQGQFRSLLIAACVRFAAFDTALTRQFTSD